MASVLVLCQRKSGPDVKAAVDPIMNLIFQLVGPTKDITFMSDKGRLEGEVDIDQVLSMYNEFTKRFIIDMKNHYDLVILNTCPYQIMDYKIIYTILKNTGLLAATAYTAESNNYSKIPKIINILSKVDNFYTYFTNTETPNIFRKNSQTAGGQLSELRTLCNKRGMSCYTKDKKRFLTRKEILKLLSIKL